MYTLGNVEVLRVLRDRRGVLDSLFIMIECLSCEQASKGRKGRDQW